MIASKLQEVIDNLKNVSAAVALLEEARAESMDRLIQSNIKADIERLEAIRADLLEKYPGEETT